LNLRYGLLALLEPMASSLLTYTEFLQTASLTTLDFIWNPDDLLCSRAWEIKNDYPDNESYMGTAKRRSQSTSDVSPIYMEFIRLEDAIWCENAKTRQHKVHEGQAPVNRD
jgi:hypothetical protein